MRSVRIHHDSESRAPAGRTALVIGGSIAGQLAAAALAGNGFGVTILDRDRLPEEAVPRSGLPQGRHLHALMVGGERSLEALLPGITGRLVAAGALVLTPEAYAVVPLTALLLTHFYLHYRCIYGLEGSDQMLLVVTAALWINALFPGPEVRLLSVAFIATQSCLSYFVAGIAKLLGQSWRDGSAVRAILNFGHTFGHAIETAAGYGTWLHGEAVAAGMAIATDLSARLGWIDAADRDRALSLIARFGLPVTAPRIGAQRARELMGMDKKVLDGRIRLILLRSVGRAEVVADYSADALDVTLRAHFDEPSR